MKVVFGSCVGRVWVVFGGVWGVLGSCLGCVRVVFGSCSGRVCVVSGRVWSCSGLVLVVVRSSSCPRPVVVRSSSGLRLGRGLVFVWSSSRLRLVLAGCSFARFLFFSAEWAFFRER